VHLNRGRNSTTGCAGLNLYQHKAGMPSHELWSGSLRRKKISL
jgi:hypothetical protein